MKIISQSMHELVKRGRFWLPAILTSLAILFALGPTAAWAQAGWYVLSSLQLNEEFDDNISASSSNRKADWITRLANASRVGYRSTPLTLLATSDLNAEAFLKNPDRDGVNRKQIGLEFEYRPDRPVTLRLNASFTQTQTPSDLAEGLGLELGRQESQQLTAAASVSYRFRPGTSGEVSHSYGQTESGEVTNTTRETRFGLSHNVTKIDVGTVSYVLRFTESTQESVLQESGQESFRSDVVLLGWTRPLSATTTLSLDGGPSLSEGKLNFEFTGRVTHRFQQQGTVTLAYTRSEATVPGQTGRVTAQSLSGALSFEPLRSLRMAVAPALSQVSGEEGDTTTQRIDLTASYKLLKWLSATFRYSFSRSKTDAAAGPTTPATPATAPPATDGTAILHNIVSIGLDASYPLRVE